MDCCYGKQIALLLVLDNEELKDVYKRQAQGMGIDLKALIAGMLGGKLAAGDGPTIVVDASSDKASKEPEKLPKKDESLLPELDKGEET